MRCHTVVTPVVNRMAHAPGAELGTWTSVVTLRIGTWWGGTAADRWGSRPVALFAGSLLTAGFALIPLITPSLAGMLVVMITWSTAA
jgi:predicted MFS family arabinose efflux permease